MAIDTESRRVLLAERDKARKDSRVRPILQLPAQRKWTPRVVVCDRLRHSEVLTHPLSYGPKGGQVELQH